MISGEVALRYSKALFNLGSSNEALVRYLNDLKQIIHALNKSSQAMCFFSSPHIHLQDKENVLKNILKDKIDPLLLSFLSLLVKKRRFSYLAEIVKKYDLMVKKKLSILEGGIVTAIPLNDSTKEKLIKTLQEKFKKNVELTESVDSRIIGGGILTINNQQLDFSVRGKLKRLEQKLTKA